MASRPPGWYLSSMGGASTKLFHAIVGLGLAAAGCGRVASSGVTEPDAPKDADDDAGRAVADASTGEEAASPPFFDAPPPLADARRTFDAPPDAVARPDALDASAHDAALDVARAHDAALDVARSPPPPEIK